MKKVRLIALFIVIIAWTLVAIGCIMVCLEILFGLLKFLFARLERLADRTYNLCRAAVESIKAKLLKIIQEYDAERTQP
ncbi:MAG: hypothetical protein EPO24_15900 [Bacteroidetes bacterium]|nr:MAG: hypothetical protein EPO24_15900 [Bacteroidota bacterium]